MQDWANHIFVCERHVHEADDEASSVRVFFWVFGENAEESFWFKVIHGSFPEEHTYNAEDQDTDEDVGNCKHSKSVPDVFTISEFDNYYKIVSVYGLL